MEYQIIQQGAEAIIYKDKNRVIKKRIKKNYRIDILDKKLRKSRTKSETKIIKKLENIIPVPKIIKSDYEQEITMEFIYGKKLSENLEELNFKKICKLIASNISKIHNQGIIHGDLTTSNMIYVEKENKVYFIDFGLSFHSNKIEDKAVDLHLLQKALEAKHFKIWKDCWTSILKHYNAKNAEEIKRRIKIIESRGRYKERY
ncbi:MAG: KEOPS complex kinase/ATPase Bud32 [Candidatus Pacearchaeota archaeon]